MGLYHPGGKKRLIDEVLFMLIFLDARTLSILRRTQSGGNIILLHDNVQLHSVSTMNYGRFGLENA